MSIAANKALVRRFIEELLNTGNLALADELLCPTFVSYALPDPRQRIERFTYEVGALRTAFPDLHFMIQDLDAAGDRVVAWFTMSGTHQGAYAGVLGTGRSGAQG